MNKKIFDETVVFFIYPKKRFDNCFRKCNTFKMRENAFSLYYIFSWSCDEICYYFLFLQKMVIEKSAYDASMLSYFTSIANCIVQYRCMYKKWCMYGILLLYFWKLLTRLWLLEKHFSADNGSFITTRVHSTYR